MSRPKSILVVGDLMIDRSWVVPNKSARSTSQAHDDIPPRKLIYAHWQTDILGGAATVARAAVAAAPDFVVYLAAAWKEGFDPSEFLSPEDSVKGSPGIKFIHTAATTFNTEKVRVYEQTSGMPKLVNRDDRDLFFDKDNPIYTYNSKPKVPWPSRKEVGVLIVADFKKGLLDLNEVREILKTQYKGLPFLLRSKRKADDNVFTELPWTLALPNREDLTRLVNLEEVEAPTLQRLPNDTYIFNPRLEDSITRFFKAFPTSRKKNPERSILIKLDREGALLCERKSGKKDRFTALLLGTGQTKLAGIGAGDVLAANLAVNLIRKTTHSSSLSYSDACIEAVPAATAFCKSAAEIRHRPNNGNNGWFGAGMSIDEARRKQVRANFQSVVIGERASSVLVKGKRPHAKCYIAAIKATNPSVSIVNAKWFLDRFLTVDKELGAEILRVKSEVKTYFEAHEMNARPFVVALCGTPGSGKSALAKALASALDCDSITGNAAQWTSVDDLFRLCEEIRSIRVKKERGRPFVFIDEVDTAVAGEKLYGKLLAPLGDGEYSYYGYTRKLGPVAFLLAGSNYPWTTRNDLLSKSKNKNAKSQLEKDHPKLLDLLSRFSSPPLDVPELGNRRMDALYLAAFQLRERFPGLQDVESGVLRLLCQSTPKHGPRSIIEVIRLIDDLKDSRIVTTKDIKDAKDVDDALKLHLDHISSDWRKLHKRVRVTP